MSLVLSSIGQKLSGATTFFGLKLWATIIICIGFTVGLIILGTIVCFISRRRPKSCCKLHASASEIDGPRKSLRETYGVVSSLDKRLLSCKGGWDIEMIAGLSSPQKKQGMAVHSAAVNTEYARVGSDVKRCIKFTMGEIEAATDGFAEDNIIGRGDYGIVCRGVLLDNTRVAVKKLISKSINTSNSEVFAEEVEAMWCIRHRNIVKLLGYCAQNACRMLVYEYVDNGNLEQWLRGCKGRANPLTWNTRMNIILGAAKGLTYLQEDIEPQVVHQHIKSSNILVDLQWNPKLSDFGIAKLLGHEWNHVVAPPMGMLGYVAPEYVCNGILDKKSDIYSFGILIMEILTGKPPIDRSTTEIEVYLIDWLKFMVSNENFKEVVDPKLPEIPSSKELKRILLIALRCVDPDAGSRPSMGDIIHMLEPRDLLLCDDSRNHALGE